MTKINLIRKKLANDDDTIQYYSGPHEPDDPLAGDIWMNTNEGKFYVHDGADWSEADVENIDFNDFPESPADAYDRAMGVV